MGVVENPTGSKPTSPGRLPSNVAGQPFSANGSAADGRSNATGPKAVETPVLAAGGRQMPKQVN